MVELRIWLGGMLGMEAIIAAKVKMLYSLASFDHCDHLKMRVWLHCPLSTRGYENAWWFTWVATELAGLLRGSGTFCAVPQEPLVSVAWKLSQPRD